MPHRFGHRRAAPKKDRITHLCLLAERPGLFDIPVPRQGSFFVADRRPPVGHAAWGRSSQCGWRAPDLGSLASGPIWFPSTIPPLRSQHSQPALLPHQRHIGNCRLSTRRTPVAGDPLLEASEVGTSEDRYIPCTFHGRATLLLYYESGF